MNETIRLVVRKIQQRTWLRRVVLGWSVILTLTACVGQHPLETSKCESLAQLKLDQAQVLSARAVSAGHRFSMLTAFVGIPLLQVPAACRVELLLTPSEDSAIHSEIWLPLSGWNGRFQGLGNGGFAGSIDELGLTLALQRGYAAAATDTGHTGNDKDGSWAIGHPEKIHDYGYRGIHETTVKAKILVASYYGTPPKYSYFGSCSNGGRQGLMEAQRYPDDYDGVLAGAPAYDGTNTIPTWAWIQRQLQTSVAYIPKKKLAVIAAAVLAKCDANDGLADGVIDDPRACDFRPESLQCRGADTDDCLTTPQVDALRQIYAGPGGALNDSRHHGFEPGGELGKFGWADWFTGSGPLKSVQYVFSLEFYRNLVYDDPNWNLDRFEFSRDRRAMQERLGPDLDANSVDLDRFKVRGGKLIMFHGWSDAALQPRLTIDYYERLRARLGPEATHEFARLYMVPGMQHCFGGPGPNVFGQLVPASTRDSRTSISAALENWVETGQSPEAIIASKFDSDLKALIAPERSTRLRTRPLCPYPQVGRYSGQGSIDAAENFHCVTLADAQIPIASIHPSSARTGKSELP
jgi:feruloyl esterase